MAEYILSGDDHAIWIDAEDVNELSNYIWWCANGYASTQIEGKTVYMHRLLMDCPDGWDVHHKNHNKLDNQKANLEICSRSRNLRNKQKPPKGYYKDRRGKWVVETHIGNKKVALGSFATETQAARLSTKVFNRLAEREFKLTAAQLLTKKTPERAALLLDDANYEDYT